MSCAFNVCLQMSFFFVIAIEPRKQANQTKCANQVAGKNMLVHFPYDWKTASAQRQGWSLRLLKQQQR